jgi:D-aspartate ligase
MAMDLVRPLAGAGIGAAVVAQRDDPERFSRFTRAVVETSGHSEPDEQVVDRLLDFGRRQSSPPVLFYTDDKTLALASSFRERLDDAFAFVIADHGLVCDLVDKGRFQALAERLSLPVPRATLLDPAANPTAPDLDLSFPVVLKPTSRLDYLRWSALEPRGKAFYVASAEELRLLWPRLAASGIVAVAQELVAGHENEMVSYHTYIDADGCVVGEFTGRKMRTYPSEFGHTTALAVSADREVADLGRDILRRLGLRGVAKVDFKRGPDGRLRLLALARPGSSRGATRSRPGTTGSPFGGGCAGR